MILPPTLETAELIWASVALGEKAIMSSPGTFLPARSGTQAFVANVNDTENKTTADVTATSNKLRFLISPSCSSK
jgi:hypothetical protein